METTTVKLTGIVPLIQHNNQTVSPLNAYAKALKPLTSKRNKTDSDFALIAHIEWEAGLYLNDGVVVIPGDNIARSFWDGAKKHKQGPMVKEGVFVESDFIPLTYSGPKIHTNGSGEIPNPDFEKHFEKHVFQKAVKISRQTIIRTRPIFYDWSLEVVVLFDEVIINQRTLLDCIRTAGQRIGLCDWRPRFGRYTVEAIS